MVGADGDAVTQDEVSGDVYDGLGHRILAGSFEGVAVELVDLAEVAIVRPGTKGSPARLFVINASTDAGQVGNQFVCQNKQRRGQPLG